MLSASQYDLGGLSLLRLPQRADLAPGVFMIYTRVDSIAAGGLCRSV